MASPQRRPDDGPEGDLPPDPWAGLAATPPPGPADRTEGRPGGRSDDLPPPSRRPGPDPDGRDVTGGPAWHPSGQDVAGRGDTPLHRSLLGHPAFWVVLTAVALLALWAAWLDGPSAPPAGDPSPGTVSTAPFEEAPPGL